MRWGLEYVVSIPEMVRLIGEDKLGSGHDQLRFNSRDGAIDSVDDNTPVTGVNMFQFQRWCD